MKKFFGALLIALFLVPVAVKASVSIDALNAEPDANGVFTSKVVIKVPQGETIYDIPVINIEAHHAFIDSVEAIEPWTKDANLSVLNNGINGTLKIGRPDLSTGYAGTGEFVAIAEIKYRHDNSYTGTDECYINVGFSGDTTKKIQEKTTTNAPTGSFLPYAGIVAGVGLIAVAFVMSKKSTKLYKF